MIEPGDLPAPTFSSWLRLARRAQVEDCGAEVPCAECNACCRSSYFIHIRPDETLTLATIPQQLQFPAPGLPEGTMLLGYDEDGRCPLLGAQGCTIYADRPITCRTYDCRVFAAADIPADRDEISERARRWTFSYPTPGDRLQHAAVKAAARFLQEHADCFPGGAVPSNPPQVAVLALKAYDVFLKSPDGLDTAEPLRSDLELADALMAANERFEASAHVTPPLQDV